MTGLRPVAEILYIDFSTLAMDQIVNQAAKAHYMFGGKARAPLVIRMVVFTGGLTAGLQGSIWNRMGFRKRVLKWQNITERMLPVWPPR